MACGPAMNILLAFLILLGVAATYGVYRSQLTISKVQECIVAADAADKTCEGKPPTPAAAGIQPGGQACGVQRNRRVVVGRRFALDPGKPGPLRHW